MKLTTASLCAVLVVGACGGSTAVSTTAAVVETSTTTAPTSVTSTSTSSTTSTSTSTTTLPPTTTTTLSDGPLLSDELLTPEDPECTVLMAGSWLSSEFGSLVAFNESDAASAELAAALSTLGLTAEDVSARMAISSEESFILSLENVVRRTILWDSATNDGSLGYILVCASYVGPTVTGLFENAALFFAELYAGRYDLPGQIPVDPDQAAFGEGEWRVGVDIRPGTYQAEGGDNCYWAFLRGFPGQDIGNIMTNDYGESNILLTIAPELVGFVSSDCGLWVPVQ